jgi:hypothetical protein
MVQRWQGRGEKVWEQFKGSSWVKLVRSAREVKVNYGKERGRSKSRQATAAAGQERGTDKSQRSQCPGSLQEVRFYKLPVLGGGAEP